MKLLLVEDDQNKRELITEFVQSTIRDAQITEAKSFQSGLRQLLSGRYDLVLLDMTLPTFDRTPNTPAGRTRPFAGREILEQAVLRGLACPAIVITGFETFGEGEEKQSLTELTRDLERSFPKQYLGMVSYVQDQSVWQTRLKTLIAAARGKRK